MSGKASKWAWEQQPRTSAAKLVLLCLADMANQHDVCWPSHATLSLRTGLSRSSVIRAIKELKEDAYLIVIERKTKGGQTTNLYKIPVC